jgi:hypothetical protein
LGGRAADWGRYSTFQATAGYRVTWDPAHSRAGLEATGLTVHDSNLADDPANGTTFIVTTPEPPAGRWQALVTLHGHWPDLRVRGEALVDAFDNGSGYQHTGDVLFQPVS